MHTHFFFKTAAADAIALACFRYKFWDHKQADALDTLGCRWILNPCQNHVADIAGQVLIARGDKYFCAGQLIGAIGLFHSLRIDEAQICAALRFSQTHRACPFTGDYFLQICLFLLFGAVFMQHSIGRMRQTGVEAESDIGGTDHLAHCCIKHKRHAQTAVCGVTGEGCHAGIAELLIGFFKACRGLYAFGDAVMSAAFKISNAVQRRELFFRYRRDHFKALVDRVCIHHIFKSLQLRELADVQYFVQNKTYVIEGGFIAGGHFRDSCGLNFLWIGKFIANIHLYSKYSL